MRWFEKPEILSYLVDCYQGTVTTKVGPKRQFIWEVENGDVVIGNTRAFADHLFTRFGLTDKACSDVHEAMRELGEVTRELSPRLHHGTRYREQKPEMKVIIDAATVEKRAKARWS